MPSTKYEGLSYPDHFLKSRGSVIRNNFLEYRTNKVTHFAQRNDFYALLAINKAGALTRLTRTQLYYKSFLPSCIREWNKFLLIFEFQPLSQVLNISLTITALRYQSIIVQATDCYKYTILG